MAMGSTKKIKNMTYKNIYFIVAFVIILAIIIFGVYFWFHLPVKENNNTNVLSKDTIKIVSGQPNFFTDNIGMTLYHSIRDFSVKGKTPPYSECVEGCSAIWPPFYTETIIVSEPLKAGDFTTFIRSDGQKQTAWRGWPLYYYSGDRKVGDINGQGIENVWYIGVSPK